MSYAFNVPFKVEKKESDDMSGIADGSREIIIDRTSTKIIGNAFYGRTGLLQVSVPNATSIGDRLINGASQGNVFYYCQNLSSVDLPNVETMYGQYNFALSTGPGSLTDLSLPKCRNLSGRTFFYRSGLTTVRLPALNTVDGMVYDFYGCNGLINVYMTSLQSSVAIETKTTAGGFPWGAVNNNCVFHFEDGNFDKNGNPV